MGDGLLEAKACLLVPLKVAFKDGLLAHKAKSECLGDMADFLLNFDALESLLDRTAQTFSFNPFLMACITIHSLFLLIVFISKP